MDWFDYDFSLFEKKKKSLPKFWKMKILRSSLLIAAIMKKRFCVDKIQNSPSNQITLKKVLINHLYHDGTSDVA